MRILLSLLVAVALTGAIALPSPARAQFGIKLGGGKKKVDLGSLDPRKPSKQQRETLNDVNRRSQQGSNLIAGSWRSGCEQKAAKFAEALQIHQELSAKIDQKLMKLDAWKNVERYWNEFDQKVQQGKLQAPVCQAYEPVKRAHDSGKVVEEAALQQLKAATDAYLAGANESTKRDARWLSEQSAAAFTRNAQLAEAGALKAAKAASSAEMEAQNAQLDWMDKTLKYWGGIIKKKEAPIPEAQFADFERVLATVNGFKPTARSWYGERLWYARLYNAWLTGDGEAIAAAMGAKHVKSGDTAGKKMLVSFAAKPGECYLMLGKWKVDSGSEKTDLDWKFSVPTAALGFGLFRTTVGRASGFCANKPLKATRVGNLTFAGTTNSMHWTVVKWPRADFPMPIATVMSVNAPDPCSPAHKFLYWTQPVPGAIVYVGNEPRMRTSDDDMWLTAKTLNGGDTRVQWKAISSVAPAVRTFGSAYRFGGCWGAESSHDLQAKKLARCKDALYKKFSPRYRAANKKKDRAKYVHEVKQANAMLAKIEKQEKAAYRARCLPTEKLIRKKMERNYNRLVDWFADNAPENPLDVQKTIIEQRDAKYDRPGRR